MNDLDFRDLRGTDIEQAIRLIARGMRDNPVHERIFGPDPQARTRRLAHFYRCVLPRIHSKGRVLGGFCDGDLVGAVGVVPPGRCRPTVGEIAAVTSSLLFRCPPSALMRIRRWAGHWRRNDLPEPHWHLGPAAIDSSLQRQGLGSAFLQRLCDLLDGEGMLAYLETERAQNVALYLRFGFTTVAESSILDVPCWFMRRPPGAVAAPLLDRVPGYCRPLRPRTGIS